MNQILLKNGESESGRDCDQERKW